MMRNLSIRLLLLLAMMLPTFLGAQDFTGQATQRVYPSVVKTLEAWEVFKIDAAAVSAYAQDNLNNPIINLHLGKHEWNLMLTPNYKLVENYLLQVQTDAGIEKSFPTQIRAFRGYDLNSGGRSCLTLDGDFLYGYVEVGAERFYIEPLWYYNENAPRDEFIVYKKSDVIYDSNVTCASIEGDELLEEYIGNEDIKQGDAAESLACYEIDIAIASDLSMFNKYGSVGAVEIHNIAVLNNVTTDYTGNFTNDFEFNIVTQFVVTGSNPWSNSTDAGTLLGSFRNWGNAGNFGVNFDVGELWTNRDFNGGTIGIAYLNGVCNSNKYHCLQDFSNNAELLRCLTSHEIGHNFSATHDTSPGDCPPNYIMCPFVSTSNTWSSQSVSQISSYSQSKINSGCLTVCSSGGPPLEASFTVNPNPACVNEQVFFGDQSSGIISNYSWVFPGGSPATSTQPNPVVTWAVAGSYDVTLTISDAAGQSATATETVVIKPLPVANFSYTVTGLTLSFTNLSTDAFSYIWDFGDGNASFDANPIHAYDEAGMYVVTLTAENDCGISTKTFLINTAPTAFFSASPTEGCAALTVSFQNESSSNATSFQWSFTGGFPAASNLENPVVVYPTSGVYNVSLTAFNNSGSATYIANGFITVTNVPSSGFTFDVNGLIVEFTNTSTNGDSFLWNFGDGNTSTEEDPVHVYDIGGSYTVTLTTTNDCGTTTSTHVVNMVPPPVADFTAGPTSGCASLVVQYTNSSVDADTYMWSFPGGSPATSTDENPEVTYDDAGTYSATLIATNVGGSDTLTFQNYITVEDTPDASFDYAANMDTVSFTNNTSNGNSYSWDFGDGSTSTEAEPTHIYSEDGNYNVVLIATNDCGDDTTMLTVFVVTPPIAGFSADAIEGCLPFTVNFTNESSENATDFSWEFEGGDPATSTDENPSSTWNAAGTYTVTLTASNGAGSSTSTITITVNDVPTSDFTSDVNGADVDFTNNSTNTDSYSWDFGDGNSSTEADPSHTYTEDGVYTVVLTSTNACGSTTSTMTVTIVTPPVAGFSADAIEGCLPFTVNFTNESSENATDFSWEFEGGDPATSTDENPSSTWNAAGTYTVTLTASNGAGSSTSTITITVNDVPTSDFTSDVNGADVDFTNNSTNADSYSWDFGDGNSSTEADPSHTYTEDGVYTVVLTSTNACGSTTSTMTVTIVTPPVAGFSADAIEGCLPFTVNFTNESSENATDFSWGFEGGDPATSTDENPSSTWNAAGTYTVTLTASNGAGSSTSTITITVNDVPTSDFTSDVTGADVDFTNNSTNADSYSWDFGDGNSSTEADPSHTYTEDGVYTVVLTSTNACGSTTSTMTVTIVTPPVAGFSADAIEGCLPFTVNFTNESSENATDFSWEFEGGDPATSTDENPSSTWNAAGTYTVVLTASNSAGSSTSTITITVNDVPTVDFTTQLAGLTLVTTNNSMNADTYEWNFGDGSLSGAFAPTHTYDAPGSYEVTLTATNECGSSTTTSTVEITGSAPLPGFTSESQVGCVPFVVNFMDTSEGDPISWKWSFPGGDPATSTDQNPTVTYNTPGTFDVTLEVTNIYGTSMTTQMGYIVAETVPTVDFDFTTDLGTVTFENLSQDADAYTWNFGDGNTSNEENPTHTYTEDGTYTVELTALNNCGASTLQQTVMVIVTGAEQVEWVESFNLYPNPNAGNFTLQMQGTPQRELQFTLYNAIGQLIKQDVEAFDTGRLNKQFNFDYLQAGVYTLGIRSGNSQLFVKVIIQ